MRVETDRYNLIHPLESVYVFDFSIGEAEIFFFVEVDGRDIST